jgi:hypothetical protein
MTLIETALLCIFMALVIGLYQILNELRNPTSRREMGIRLPEDDDEYKFIEVDPTPEQLEQIMKEFKNAK